MRPAVFLDTSAWFAALSPREERHAEARRTYAALLKSGARLVTTNLVVAEMQVLLMRRLSAAAGVALLDAVYADGAHEVRFATRELEAAAVDRWLRPLRERELSLCDAVSFAVMREEGIARAFAYDHHFAGAGFEVVTGGG